MCFAYKFTKDSLVLRYDLASYIMMCDLIIFDNLEEKVFYYSLYSSIDKV